jgi:hypothetical protein
MGAIGFGRELWLAVVFIVPPAYRGDDGIVEAVRASGLPANVSAGGQGAKDAVDGSSRVSAHAAEIFDAQAGPDPAERLDHLDGLEYTGDQVVGIP